MSSGKWKNRTNILKERNPAASEGAEHVQKGGGGDEGSESVGDIRSEIRPSGVKDLKRNGIKAVQFKLKATAEEPKKKTKPRTAALRLKSLENGARKAPMEED